MSSSDSDLDLLEDSPGPQSSVESAKARRLWTKQEDEKLRLLVSYWGDQGGRRSNWDKIAANFEERSAKSCRKRWFHSLDPKLRRGRWNKTEDKILKESYDRLGPAWQRIAQLIPGRTDDQCAKRYNDVVNPAVQDRLRPWTAEEDEKLLGFYAKYGSKWQTIANHMPSRTGLTCRNRWRKLTRPQKPATPKDVNGNAGISEEDASKAAAGPGPSVRMVGANGGSTDNIDIGLPFDVPGSNQVAGFPAGADANWFLGGNSNGAGYAANGSPVIQQQHHTITIEDLNNPGHMQQQPHHHAIMNEQLQHILEFAAKNQQQVVIHQHIYQMQPQSTMAGQVPQRTPTPMMQTPLPVFPPGPGLVDNNGASSLLRTVHPPVQPPERPPSRPNIFMGDPYNRGVPSEQQLPPPPPDEFLSRPLLFDEQQSEQTGHFETEEADFLAFNPS